MDGADRADSRIPVFRRIFIIPAFLSKNLQSEVTAAGFFGPGSCDSSITATCHTATKELALPGGILFAVRSGWLGLAGGFTSLLGRVATPVPGGGVFLVFV